MAVVGTSRSDRFKIRINMKNSPRCFGPIEATCINIEQSKIGDEMFFVVGSKALGGRCQVCDLPIKQWFPHRTSLFMGWRQN
jgi:hypothetical protein